jgi:hypothetical protein
MSVSLTGQNGASFIYEHKLTALKEVHQFTRDKLACVSDTSTEAKQHHTSFHSSSLIVSSCLSNATI